MSTELVEKPSYDLASMQDEFSADMNMSAKDLVISKILAMQGLSKMVTDGKAKFGDFVDSISGEVVGDMNNPVEIIPFMFEKVWIVSEFNGKKHEYKKTIPVTLANENLQYEVGTTKNEYCYKFFCLKPNDMSLPIIVQFKGTSRRTGSEMLTQMYVKNKAAGKLPVAQTFMLTGSKESNDDGTFVVMKAKIGRPTTDEEIKECITWLRTMKSSRDQFKEDDSDLRGATEAAAPSAPTQQQAPRPQTKSTKPSSVPATDDSIF